MVIRKDQAWPPYDQTRDVKALQRQVKQIQVQSKGSEWYDFTCTWSSTGTQPVLGNAVLIPRYQRIGSTCIVRIDFTAGSSTTYGTGTYSWSLPFMVAAWMGVGGYFHLNTATTRYGGQMVADNAASTMSAYVPTSGSPSTLSAVTNTVPVTLAAGHRIRMGVEYEVNGGL